MHKELYEQTSQYRNWRFTKKELHDLREHVNKSGIDRAKQNRIMEQNAKNDAEENQSSAMEEVHSNEINYLSLEDELRLINFYETKIRDYSRVYKFTNNIKATAIMFMKRFYLLNTVIDYPPKQIMLTCLFLATKVENLSIQINDFIKPLPKTTADDVLDNEFLVSQSLKFEYSIQNPYKAAYGLYLELQTCFEDLSLLLKCYNLTLGYVEISLFTDLGLIYQPSQIALAAWKLAGSKSGLDIDMYLTKKFSAQLLILLYPILDDIQDVISKHTIPKTEEVREIDRRLIFCRNPEKNPGSILYKLRMSKEKDENSPKVSTDPSNGIDKDDVFSK